MTATTNTPPGAPEQQKPETVDLTIDGADVATGSIETIEETA